ILSRDFFQARQPSGAGGGVHTCIGIEKRRVVPKICKHEIETSTQRRALDYNRPTKHEETRLIGPSVYKQQDPVTTVVEEKRQVHPAQTTTTTALTFCEWYLYRLEKAKHELNRPALKTTRGTRLLLT
ncbi:unnamed protein product, partial [Ectocarpus sp. 12 AP-2014]